MKREKGERYRPTVTIEKMKGDIPSVITISGKRYVYDPSDHWKGKSKKG